MKKDAAILQESNPVQDSEGGISNEWVNVATISGTKLPITSEMAIKQYGYSKNVSYQYFTKDTNPKLTEGNQLVFNGEPLVICHISDFKKIKVVLLKQH